MQKIIHLKIRNARHKRYDKEESSCDMVVVEGQYIYL